MTEKRNILPSTYKEQKRGENAKDLRRKFEKFQQQQQQGKIPP